MPIDVDTPESPGWYFRRQYRAMRLRPLGKRSRAERMDLLWSYMVGDAPLPRHDQAHAEDVRAFIRMARANYALLIVDAMLNRTRHLGVKTSIDGDTDGDDLARAIGEGSGLLSVAADIHTFQFALSEGYGLVNAPDPDSGIDLPVITAQDPRQCITLQDPLRPQVARAGLLMYRDEDRELDVAHVFTPGRVDVATRKMSLGAGPTFSKLAWDWDEDSSGDYPAGMERVVPLQRFSNRLGFGEYELHLDLLNRINNTIADRLWIAKFQAFKQRAVSGNLPDVHPETGEVIDYNDILAADPGAVWKLPAGTELWESASLDLTPILSSIRDDVKELAAVTQTPLHMFTPDAASGSAEGASLQRESTTYKVEDRIARTTPSWLSLWRTVFLFAGDRARAEAAMQAMWAPAERFSLAQRGAAASQGKASGLSQARINSELWQFDPVTVAQEARDLQAEQEAMSTVTATPSEEGPPTA